MLTALAFFSFAVALPSKRGLSEPVTPSMAQYYCEDLKANELFWSYSWGLSPPNISCGPTANFEPMFWGEKSILNASLFYSVSATHVLGFNEPNVKGQSNLTPTQAAKLWSVVEGHAKAANLKIVAPVPSGRDTQWLVQFFQACGGCEGRIDVIALHPYDCDGEGLKASLAAYSVFDKPLWVTEFNCGDGSRNASSAEHLAYMKIALPILDEDPRVERYAWMSGRDSKVPGAALFSGNSLTELGRFYTTPQQTM